MEQKIYFLKSLSNNVSDTGDYNGLRPQMKSGVPWNESVWAMMDFILAVFFFVYFWLRYIAAEDKLKFVFSMESVVDYFTIPPLILAGNFVRNIHCFISIHFTNSS